MLYIDQKRQLDQLVALADSIESLLEGQHEDQYAPYGEDIDALALACGITLQEFGNAWADMTGIAEALADEDELIEPAKAPGPEPAIDRPRQLTLLISIHRRLDDRDDDTGPAISALHELVSACGFTRAEFDDRLRRDRESQPGQQ